MTKQIQRQCEIIRRRGIIQLRERDPCATLQTIGDQIGVSKEWVRQILAKYGKPTKHFIQSYICNNCGRIIPDHKKAWFCSEECRHNYKFIKVSCEVCGQLTERLATHFISEVKRGYQHTFCSKHCQGIRLAKLFGFGVHPENAGSHSRKYDYESIWQKHLETGYGSVRLARELGIPRATLDVILKKMRING